MKKENFEHELNEFIEKNKDNKFKYGKWDCFIFAVQAVKIISGKDYSKGNKYKSKKDGLALLKTKGGYLNVLDNLFSRIDNINLTQRGDLVYYEGAIGICIGAKSIFVNEEGYTFINTNEAQAAYKV